jgi:hypothetical protein
VFFYDEIDGEESEKTDDCPNDINKISDSVHLKESNIYRVAIQKYMSTIDIDSPYEKSNECFESFWHRRNEEFT